MSFTTNTNGEDVTADQSTRTITPMNVFYDAWDELSSDSGHQPQSSVDDLLAEAREMRLSLLIEIEKRKQAEDVLNSMQYQWQVLREKLREVGLVLPANLSPIAQDAQMNVDFTNDICQQIYITRFVSESIGRGAARAECEEEMEARVEAKNFAIARLCDRLHYYETMNWEMSHRNQEAIGKSWHDATDRGGGQYINGFGAQLSLQLHLVVPLWLGLTFLAEKDLHTSLCLILLKSTPPLSDGQ